MDVTSNWAASDHPGSPQNTTIINRIMLRFRPIAPKPVANSSAVGSTVDTQNIEVFSKRRTKRKYVRVKKNRNCKNKEEEKEKNDGSDDHESVVTLQLLPESSGGVKSSPEHRSYRKNVDYMVQDEYNNILSIGAPSNLLDRTAEMRSTRLVESWVMVDGVTNTCVDGDVLGSTDMEKMMNLEGDTCPGFISDGLDNVKWVNLAYRRMIDPVVEEEHGGAAAEMVVWLVMKEKRIVPLLPAFACTVRVVYTWQKMKQSRTMPCDVWKMDFGGFAWRFDATAALSLGR